MCIRDRYQRRVHGEHIFIQIPRKDMSQKYKKLEVKRFPQKLIRTTSENKYWNRYQAEYDQTESAAISVVAGNRNQKEYMAYSYGFTVGLYNCRKQMLKAKLEKLFKANVTGLCFRADGRLLASGEESGVVQIIDTKRRSTVRRHKRHNKPVHGLAFSQMDSLLYSVSDDLNIRIFDFSTNTVLRSLSNVHSDYIRGICVVPNTNDKCLTSSYDGTIRLLDLNNPAQIEALMFNHGTPVEAVDMFPNGVSFISVGGNETKVWDIRNNEKPLFSFANNQKTVTSVRVLSSGERFLTGSLDQLIKVYDPKSMLVTHQFEFEAGILGFEVSDGLSHLGVGLANGRMTIRSRKIGDPSKPDSDEEIPVDDEEEEKYEEMDLLNEMAEKRKRRVKDYRFFHRGIYETPEHYDVKFEETRRRKVMDYDKYLRKFQYREALNAALKTTNTGVILGLIEELAQRGALEIALSNRDDEELKLLFGFLVDKVLVPNMNSILLEITNMVIEIYGTQIGQRPILQDFLETLRNNLNDEQEIQRDILQISGQVETLISVQQNIYQKKRESFTVYSIEGLRVRVFETFLIFKLKEFLLTASRRSLFDIICVGCKFLLIVQIS
eukprot:TRINITY_DN8331_c0_g1_i4.p1 TRINITY_DN8331_c0_g1~~TRINITY_DN8331_c0_g1_i4.p1  ORF type:complete len:608 (-),score=160.92 TRINITY_DN8331_c0_g1_i4:84-1907(-)